MTNSARTGVYTITNCLSGRTYVGSTRVNLSKRWHQHKSNLRKGRHPNKELQKDWVEFGEPSFVFEVLEVVDNSYCIAFEQFWINMLRANEPAFGYNLTPCAGSSIGYKHDSQARQKISRATTGRQISEAHRSALFDGLAKYIATHGHPAKSVDWSDERRSAWSEVMKARNFKHSEDGLKKLSDANKGKVLDEDHRAKISVALKGRPVSEDTRRKLSAAHKGKKLSPETINKMRARTYSAETLAKRSAALKAAWERRKARASAQEKTRTGDSV